MNNIKGLISLPDYLKNKGTISRVKIVCVVDRQIPMPSHLVSMSKSDDNIPILVDLIGIELSNGDKYFTKGKAVAILGPKALEPTKAGKRVLLLQSSITLYPGIPNYITLTNIFHKDGKGAYLYATKTLSREGNDIKKTYPEFISVAMGAYRNNWDINKGFLSLNIVYPSNYTESCQGVVFEMVAEEDKFVFKQLEDLKPSNLQDKVVEEPNIVKPIENASTLQNTNKVFKAVTRKSLRDKTEHINNLNDLLNETDEKVTNYIDKMLSDNENYDVSYNINYTYKKLKEFWRRAPSTGAYTGRLLFRKALEELHEDLKENRRKDTDLDSLLLTTKLLDVWGNGTEDKSIDKYLLESLIKDRELIYIHLLDILLGLRGKFAKAYISASAQSINFLAVVSKNPYNLTLLDSRIGVSEMDKLALFYGVSLSDTEVLKLRNAAYMHSIMLDTNDSVIKKDTIIKKSILEKSVYPGIVLTEKQYTNLIHFNSIISNIDFVNLKTYIEAGLYESNFELPQKGWVKQSNRNSVKYVLNNIAGNNINVVSDYLSMGLGIEYTINNTKYIMDYSYLQKELYILNKIYSLLNMYNTDSIPESVLNNNIKQFENMKSRELGISNFKLEENQALAVKMVVNRVLAVTGPAGSGKTTTAEAIIYGLTHLLDVAEDDIMFCAPTGKAANRLKEVVKRKTKTIHSLFSVGGDSYGLTPQLVKKRNDIKVLVIDESSMIDINLMYTLFTKLSDDCRIVFLGDIDQLPPIGPGKPFANILNYVPTVVLNVTKRASDSSYITKNAKAIIETDLNGDITDLEQSDDFRIIPEKEETIKLLIKGIVSYHLGYMGDKKINPRNVINNMGTDLKPDDIQIITPINGKDWGVKNLNKELQVIFNPTPAPLVRHLKTYNNETSSTDFKIGDRVIHLENENHSPRLIQEGDSFRRLEKSEGIMNGDVGKVVGFYMASQLDFIESIEDSENEKLEPLSVIYSGGPNTMYIAVEYTDTDLLGNDVKFIVLYASEKIQSLKDNNGNTIIEVSSNALKKLDLAYVLTVHKLQGSQAKLVIVILFNVGNYTNSDFISRNILYTAISRAQIGCYLTGDVLGPNSAVAKARRIEQVGNRNSIVDYLYD